MQFIDLAAQQKRIRDKIEARIKKVLDHGQYIMGPEVFELEEKLAAYVGVKHAIGCASGTDALLMALMAYNVGPGDAIFTTPFTFVATAEVISLLGATPVFVDIDPVTFNIDPAKLEESISAFCADMEKSHLKPRGIIPVDLFGLPADYDQLQAIARKFDLFVIEDAAQSFGAEYFGRKTCSMGNVGCTSFFPAKPLGCYGDGGMCFTDDDGLAEVMRSIRIHGQGTHRYDNVRLGINGRLDTVQAAVLLAKFEIFPEEVDLRNNVAGVYSNLIRSRTGLVTPHVPQNSTSVWAQYSILAADGEQRSVLQERLLKTHGIPTAIYYPKPLHMQNAFAGLLYETDDLSISEDCARRIFSLPMHPYLQEPDQQRIAALLAD
jgi:dTDP-4-amino-4,6-dideoxygalactose transaminase